MRRFAAIIRISLGLTLTSASLLLVVHTLGIGPDEQGASLRGRRDFCEALAIHSSLLVNRNDLETLKKSLDFVVHRYPDVWSITLRKDNGQLALRMMKSSGSSQEVLELDQATVVSVPLVAERGAWGAMEVAFRPLASSGIRGLIGSPACKFFLVVTAANAVVFFFFLKHNLQHLDPSRAVPERVRSALDTIPAGLVIVDRKERILLANKSFAAAVGKLPAELAGCSLARFAWQDQGGTPLVDSRPWQTALERKEACAGATVTLVPDEGETRCYAIHASPIISDDGSHHGALVSFDDVTELETKRIELTRALEVLRTSRDEVRHQNEKLQRLATTDPLTECLNRRSFYEALESHWSSARQHHHPLSFVMVDLDHFKSINDTYGHSTGDLVLQKAAQTLRRCVRPSDLVCRFGGEEFCVLLPQTNLEQAAAAAEQYRQAIAALQFSDFGVTASLGVSAVREDTPQARDMIEQADKCLYVAKRQGRNQVVRWDQVLHDLEVDSSKVTRTGKASEISFQAVSALVSALACRDARTAEHSRRVAELCVITASGMMPVRESYLLEIAATLHEIGRLAVPGPILSSGLLPQDEGQLVEELDRIGVQLVEAAFASPPLTEILRNQRAWYSGPSREPGLPTGEEIPLGARILHVADAYDAMLSGERRRSQEEAFAELRRGSGTQFDGKVVERFLAAVRSRYEQRIPAENRFSRQAAVALGQFMERLAESLDRQDYRALAVIAGGVSQAARQHDVSDLAAIAEQLQQRVAHGPSDLQEIVRLASEVMELCRAAQAAVLKGDPFRSEGGARIATSVMPLSVVTPGPSAAGQPV